MRGRADRLLCAAVLVLGLVAAGLQPARATTRVTVTGEVIDTWCSVTSIMFAEGSAHYQCAVWCAIGGIPVSIRDEDGNVYVILRIGEDDVSAANPTIARIQAHQVTAEGELIRRDGVNYLLVSRIADDQGIVNVTHEDLGIQPFGK